MPFLKSLLTAACAIISSSTMSWAGVGSSGGGGGVACIDDVFKPGTHYSDFFRDDYQPQGEERFVYVLDHFQAQIPKIGFPSQPLMSLEGTEEEIINRFLETFAPVLPYTGNNLRNDIDSIGPIETWYDTPLNTYADADFIPMLPKGCRYVQLALRQGRVMYGDSRWIDLLGPQGRALLRIHEAVYSYHAEVMRLTQRGTQVNSVPVRQFISLVLKLAATETGTREYAKIVYELSLLIDKPFKELDMDWSTLGRSGKWRFEFSAYGTYVDLGGLLKRYSLVNHEERLKILARIYQLKSKWIESESELREKEGFSEKAYLDILRLLLEF